ncbi:cryptochrome/photolyase family protein [Mycobacterium kubicae]|uniref:Cryptochrome/photolyase family protein n=1 Tax=Mycobacterium kubicae TaxID=120959 RepID=A0AAX1JDD1_9MYCO|nr:cryptochrome/photolyase family protein [Mycobacterium kubicae]MCV7098441.1 cryptochrome/photolyase family protein [Mycobacterium kubicae]ORW02136.1 deoxyribodipyrimidine photolyase [Mycobacterium kubicae]QNI11272.1 cryptochrome/photolyase family protein [Mycobacterium kubicae]QPI39486.1 cryptochrome/photolyase family protein [Mycobacterium kubicae]
MNPVARRWCFADQLGPHFLDQPDQPVLLIESRAVFERRRFHRRKAHLVLSALRHRAAELGEQALFLQTRTYRQALDQVDGPISVCQPTTWAADRFVRSLPEVEVLPPRGFCTGRDEFEKWAGRSRHLLLENFYRDARRRFDLLMHGDQPAAGRWNFDADNREPPPKNVAALPIPAPWQPEEDEIDEQVRADLDRWEREGTVEFVGRDGPREFAVTATEAQSAFGVFLRDRLPHFGPHEDAMLSGDRFLAHSLLSATMNLGLLDPLDCAYAAEDAYRSGDAPLASVEGYIRQLIGWRDYIWHVYWHFGSDYRRRNALQANAGLPDWFTNLDADAVDARCLKDVLGQVRDHGWVHHIPRLMVLSNYALQRGWDPAAMTDWFHRCFVDGYDWVMVANVVGMSQHADGGLMATKPYAAGGAYINRMSDYCGQCPYHPGERVGERACPFTGGYWWFLSRNRQYLAGNRRMNQPLAGMQRLSDLDEVVEQQRRLGQSAP